MLILERSDRVGGRTLDIAIPGHPGRTVEAGGTWLSPTQTAALGLAERLGLATFNSYYNYRGCCDANMTEPSVRSTRILGRRTAPFPPFLIPSRVPHGFTQDPSTDRVVLGAGVPRAVGRGCRGADRAGSDERAGPAGRPVLGC